MASEYGISWIQPLIDSEKLLNQLIGKIRAAQNLSEMLDSVATPIRKFLDVDRINFYQLGQGGNAEVIAEAIKDHRLPSIIGTKVEALISPSQQELFVSERQKLLIDLNAGRTTVYHSPKNQIKKNLSYHRPSHPHYQAKMREMGITTCLLLPIVHQHQLWGFVSCQTRHSKRFSSKQLHTLQILVDQISIGIAQVELVAHAQSHNNQGLLIQKISNLLQSPAPERQLLVELTEAFRASGARLYVIPEPVNTAAQVFTHGQQPDILIEVEKNALWQRVIYNSGYSNAQEQPEQVCAISDVYQHLILEPLYFSFHHACIQSLLILPLRYSNQSIGCLTLFRSIDGLPQWTAAELQLAQALTVHLYTGIMQQRIENMLRQQSYYDLLTGLPNRLLIQQRLTLTLAKTQEKGELLAVIFLNLDRFKNVNDILGNSIGDRLLQMVTTRLRQTNVAYDLLGRWGGDEFTFLVTSHDITVIENITKSILQLLSTPFEFEDAFPCLASNNLYVQASIGVAISSYDGDDADTLLKHAHTALYRAKQKGRNHYEMYSAAPNNAAVDQLRLANILYQAIHDSLFKGVKLNDSQGNQQHFVLHYQPQVDINNYQVIGVEALIRCYDHQAHFISPAEFIPVAEETGLINQIGEWVLHTACQQNKLWQEQGVGYFPIAVNLSIRQIQHPNFMEIVMMALDHSGLAPEYLEVEITESLAIKDMKLTIDILQQLRTLGIQVSLDDFGTGYSSLTVLKHLPLDHLKVDRSFIRDLQGEPVNSIDAGIVRTIINLGHELHLTVIAEGVETIEQLEFLRSVGCDGVQGFFFSKPLPASELAAKIIAIQNQAPKIQEKLQLKIMPALS
jgi:diguanylate cyclase (GGDEF)-like protein